MTGGGSAIVDDVRRYVFGHAAETGHVPRLREIADALQRPEPDVRSAVRQLADGRVLILAPNDGEIWAANPFCAVPSGFRVAAGGKKYWGICIWDALGIAAALGADATIHAPCGDCGEPMTLAVEADVSRGPKASSTSPCLRAGGGTTSGTRDRPCCSSGTKSTSSAGAGHASCLGEAR